MIRLTAPRTELCLGIVATNLGLSRSIYHYFIKLDDTSTHLTFYRQDCVGGSCARGGYVGQQDLVHKRFSRISEMEMRESSRARSEDSDISLKPVAGVDTATAIIMHVSSS